MNLPSRYENTGSILQRNPEAFDPDPDTETGEAEVLLPMLNVVPTNNTAYHDVRYEATVSRITAEFITLEEGESE